jgi:hypothetical protein
METIPDDIFSEIICLLPSLQIPKVSLVCKRFRGLIKSGIVWKRKFKINFPLSWFEDQNNVRGIVEALERKKQRKDIPKKLLIIRDTIQEAERDAVALLKIVCKSDERYIIFSDDSQMDTFGEKVYDFEFFGDVCSAFASDNNVVFGNLKHSPWYGSPTHDSKHFYEEWMGNSHYVFQCGTDPLHFPLALRQKFQIHNQYDKIVSFK